MNTVLINRAVPGSGKTTFAKNVIRVHTQSSPSTTTSSSKSPPKPTTS